MNNTATINRDLADNQHNQNWLADLAAWNAKLESTRTYRPTPAAKPEPTIEDGSEFFAVLSTGGRVGGWTRY